MSAVPTPALFPDSDKKRVLVVDDDVDLARACKRALERFGWEVSVAHDVASAAKKLEDEGASVVLCDINLPGESGVALLDFVRLRDLDVPVILVTGSPSIQTAIDAVELGATEYLLKPVAPDVLNHRLERAFFKARAERARRAPMKRTSRSDLRPLAFTFQEALAGLYLVFQPIYDLRRKAVFAYEALMRSTHPEMRSPLTILETAERLQRLPELGRRVRELAEDAVGRLPGRIDLFVNLHSSDLVDGTLYEPDGGLAKVAERVVFEVTERASMDGITDPRSRVRDLRRLGYRIAIDDLGAGYAGLTSFALLEPDIAKLDMSLVRDIHLDPTRQRVVESVVMLCRSLGVKVVAEGIETPAELAVVRSLGCDFGQGFGLGRPDARFLTPPFPDTGS